MGYKRWSDVRHKLSPETRKRIDRQVDAEVKRLRELRTARRYTQQSLAELMGKTQVAISKIENGADLYVSTLRKYVEAMGGHLEVRAVFPDASIEIEQFANDETAA